MSAEWSFGSPVAPPPPRRGRGLLITGAVLVALALVVGVVGVVMIGRTAGGLVDGFGSTYSTPGTITRTLEGGTTYVVYELTGGTSGPTGPGLPTTLTPADISVEGPGGYGVVVLDPSELESTFEDSSGTYVGVASFDAPTTGAYVITVAGQPATVLVAPGFGSLAQTGIGVLVVGLAVVIGVIGVVLLIIGAVQRSRRPAAATPYGGTPYAAGPGPAPYGTAAPGDPYAGPAAQPQPDAQRQPAPAAPPPAAPPPPAALPPAGWYPDPQRPGGRRYWDGARWTDHLA